MWSRSRTGRSSICWGSTEPLPGRGACVAELYRYLNFDQIEGFEDAGRVVSAEEEAKVLAGV